jgi:putative ABC transport system substrate-binding protein
VAIAGAHNGAEIERAIDAAASTPHGGLIVLANLVTNANRELIIALATQHQIPAVYSFRYFVTGGGLMSYGTDPSDQYLQAADYVDRILRGAKPADLPVQLPTKYELVINLKTAKALGLSIPQSLIATADQVIE